MQLDPQQRLKLALHLPLRNQAELTRLLHDLYDPKSPKFHKYISVAEFTERFGADSGGLQRRGYLGESEWPHRDRHDAKPAVGCCRVLGEYSQPSLPRINQAITGIRPRGAFFIHRIASPPSVGLSVPLLQITGMDNYVLPHPMLQHKARWHNVAKGSGPSGEYLPSDMRAAYYGNGPLTGAGQSIGIFSFDGYLASDVQLYYSKTGMSSTVPITNVLVGGFSGACTDGDFAHEFHL